MLTNVRIKSLLIFAGCLLTILSILNVGVSYVKIHSANLHIEEKEKELLPQIFNFQELKVNVIQVQQWLTDVSATKAKPGFDDGFAEAEKYFKEGNKVLEYLIADHIKFEDDDMVKDLREFKENFKSYYTVGQKMANAYINQGTDAGNKMMEELDPFAEKLSGKLTIWIKEHKEENSDGAIAIEDEINAVETGMLTFNIVFILIIVIIFLILYRKVMSGLTGFEKGLTGFFKYLNKESKTVEPIVLKSDDEFAKMAKTVNTNIEKSKKLIEEDIEVINNVKVIVENVNKGLFEQSITSCTSNESLCELVQLIDDMLTVLENNISKDLNKIEEALDKYKNLDFTHRIPNSEGKMEIGLNSLADIINDILFENKKNGMILDDSSASLLQNIATLNQSSNEAAASLEETAAALEEITENSSSNTENVIKMANYANELSSSSNEGQQLAQKTTVSMDEINEQVNAINEAITVIDQIAFQTNILSLNAAVEAATAGEAGKGFAVVAAEVRNLASRSAEAANEIKTLVENATTKANDGKTIADKMIKGYDGLNENISNTLELIGQVEGASKEQQSGLVQINDAVTNLDQQTQKNANVANQAQEIANTTSSIAHRIVDNANKKEFIGKNDIKIKKTLSTANQKIDKQVVQKSSRKTVEKTETKKVETKQNVVTSNTNDDEWESF